MSSSSSNFTDTSSPSSGIGPIALGFVIVFAVTIGCLLCCLCIFLKHKPIQVKMKRSGTQKERLVQHVISSEQTFTLDNTEFASIDLDTLKTSADPVLDNDKPDQEIVESELDSTVVPNKDS